jgi:mannose-1-phosphate guanylyltransferase
MFEHYYAVVMAGGSGSRLWPLSRRSRPKQSLSIVGNRSMFQHAVDRLEGLFPYERIFVVTVADQVDLLREAYPEIPAQNYIIEPLPRGTASVVGLGAVAIQAFDPQATMAVLTADHLIANEVHLRDLLKSAYEVAQENFLVTLGITPSYPATGYGYIQKGESVGQYQNLDVFRVARFKEKPNQAQAEKWVSDGNHVWNSGMFTWRIDAVMKEIERQMLDLHEKLSTVGEYWGTDERTDTLEAVWPTIHPETVDYGIMENARKVAVIPSHDLGWDDIGSWESLFNILESDESGNIAMRGEHALFDTQGTLICEDSADRMIVTVGVEDLIVIDSGNAVLVCDRKQAQRVRDIVNYLKENGRDDYL